jgi:hypothetical protein
MLPLLFNAEACGDQNDAFYFFLENAHYLFASNLKSSAFGCSTAQRIQHGCSLHGYSLRGGAMFLVGPTIPVPFNPVG